jgi:nicotinamidase-related amidase
MKLLLIIDLQNEFINENTNQSIDKIHRLIEKKQYDKICFTRFINDENNPTYTRLNWKGCLSNLSREICIDSGTNKVIDKTTYSAYNEELKEYIKNNLIEEIYLCGIDIECCVLATALNLFENNYNVFVLKNYCFCTRGEDKKDAVIKILERNIGKNKII